MLFFNPPPSVTDVLLAPLRVLGLAPSAPALTTPSQAVTATRLDGTPVARRQLPSLTLVVGANGGVGARVTRLLLAQGRPVRALCRSLDAARAALGDADAQYAGLLEVVLGDVSQAQTLGGTAVGDGVTAVVTCHAARVQPKEGDTPDRSKYMQGIKFYDPEVVESPQAVELGGMLALLCGVAPSLRAALASGGVPSQPAPVVLLDGNDASRCSQYGCLDDGVMGGVSVSELVAETIPFGTAATPTAPAAVAMFRGTVSAANSGGFASVRNRNWEPPKDCSSATGISVRCFGDGQRYKLFLRTDAGWDAIAYGVSFDTVAGQWATVKLPFSSFRAIFRARTISAAPLDAKSIRSVQIMLSKFEYDGELNPPLRALLAERRHLHPAVGVLVVVHLQQQRALHLQRLQAALLLQSARNLLIHRQHHRLRAPRRGAGTRKPGGSTRHGRPPGRPTPTPKGRLGQPCGLSLDGIALGSQGLDECAGLGPAGLASQDEALGGGRHPGLVLAEGAAGGGGWQGGGGAAGEGVHAGRAPGPGAAAHAPVAVVEVGAAADAAAAEAAGPHVAHAPPPGGGPRQLGLHLGLVNLHGLALHDVLRVIDLGLDDHLVQLLLVGLHVRVRPHLRQRHILLVAQRDDLQGRHVRVAGRRQTGCACGCVESSLSAAHLVKREDELERVAAHAVLVNHLRGAPRVRDSGLWCARQELSCR